MKTTETSITQPDATRAEDNHCGMIQIADEVIREMTPAITIDDCDTQGMLRNQGVFTSLHDQLLLPASYVIRGIFFEYSKRLWDILVESPELPSMSKLLWASDYPRVEPVYCRTNQPEEAHLVEIKVHTERTVPVTGGIDWLFKSL